MMVQTGPMRETSWPSASRRVSPRSTASATARHCGSVNDTVALMLMPSAVAASIAGMPALVAGILTIMFGARPSKRRACSTIASEIAIQPRVGLDRQPPVAAVDAPRTPAAAARRRRPTAVRPPPSRSRSSVARGISRSSAAIRGRHSAIRAFSTVCAITGLHVAPTPPCSIDCRSSSRSAESFHRHVAVVCVISCSGLFHVEPVAIARIIHARSRTGHRDTETQRSSSKYFSKKLLSKCSHRSVLQLHLNCEF